MVLFSWRLVAPLAALWAFIAVRSLTLGVQGNVVERRVVPKNLLWLLSATQSPERTERLEKVRERSVDDSHLLEREQQERLATCYLATTQYLSQQPGVFAKIQNEVEGAALSKNEVAGFVFHINAVACYNNIREEDVRPGIMGQLHAHRRPTLRPPFSETELQRLLHRAEEDEVSPVFFTPVQLEMVQRITALMNDLEGKKDGDENEEEEGSGDTSNSKPGSKPKGSTKSSRQLPLPAGSRLSQVLRSIYMLCILASIGGALYWVLLRLLAFESKRKTGTKSDRALRSSTKKSK